MSTVNRQTILMQLGLSLEFGLEIEAYIQWKVAHLTEITTDFYRVRENLHGDSPLPWTAVQYYIWMLLKEMYSTSKHYGYMLINLAFPKALHPLDKIRWCQFNSMLFFLFMIDFNSFSFDYSLFQRYRNKYTIYLIQA